MNNHRARVKQLFNIIYLYNHFNMDEHSISDMTIMPIEEVVLNPKDNIMLASKLLQREEYWIRELCCIYPYGLNDSIRGVGNISRLIDKDKLVVYSFFHKA